MFPGMMGYQKLPTVKELWKNEKSKYRHWIILLGIGLLIITALSITSFVFNIVHKDDIIASIEKFHNKIYKNAMINPEKQFLQTFVVFPSLTIVALVVGVVLYVVTIFASYKAKNFARLSPWPTLAVGLGALMALVSLIMILMNSSSSRSFDTPGGIFNFVNNILFILIYILASSPVSKLRRTFLISERMEQMQNDPQFKAAQEQFSNMMKGQQGNAYGGFPFGMPPNNNASQSNATNPQSNNSNNTNTNPSNANNSNPQVNLENLNNVQKKVDPHVQKLKSMSLNQLQQVAKELSISGFNNMKKDELIQAILRVTEN